ncbi:MAG: MASE3 domain-containing protein [Candidatus Dojkabacteria bacterium]
MEKNFTKVNVMKKGIVILISTIIFLVFGYIAGTLKWLEDFQLILDLFAGIFAFFIATLSILRFYTKQNSFNYLLLGIGFLVVGFLDIFQILLTLDTFGDLFVLKSAEVFPNSVIFSRLFLSLIFFLSWFFTKQEEGEKRLSQKWVFLGLFVSFSLLIVVVTVFSEIFSSQSEYLLAIVVQTVAMMVYILTLVAYVKEKGMYKRNFDFWLIFSLAFAILSQIFFLPFLNIEYTLMLNLSTLAKFLSYLVLLIGFLFSIYEMYKSEENVQKELKKKNLILMETKKKVEEAYMVLRNEKWEISKGKSSVDNILKDILKKK